MDNNEVISSEKFIYILDSNSEGHPDQQLFVYYDHITILVYNSKTKKMQELVSLKYADINGFSNTDTLIKIRSVNKSVYEFRILSENLISEAREICDEIRRNLFKFNKP
jgi:hypothetical protein